MQRLLGDGEAAAMGEAALLDSRFEEAVQHFTKAIVLAPDNHLHYSSRAAIFMLLRSYPEARADAKRAVALNPDHAYAHLVLAGAHLALGDVASAVASCNKSLSLDPSNATVVRALLAAAVPHRQSSSSAISDAFRQNYPWMITGATRKIEIQLRMITGTQKIEIQDRGEDEAAAENGKAAFFTDRLDEAVRHFTTAINLAPDKHQYYSSRAAIYVLLRRYSEAVADAEKAVALKADYAYGYFILGSAHLGLFDAAGAIAAYDKSLALDPSFEAVRPFLVLAHHHQAVWHRIRDLGLNFGDLCNPSVFQMAQGLSMGSSSQCREEPIDVSEVAETLKSQMLHRDSFSPTFVEEDSSDLKHQDCDSLERVEKPYSTLYKDVKAWVTMGKQWQKGQHHPCLQQDALRFIGRDDIKQTITDNILSSGNDGSNCTMICINAMSGLGKTSLLRALHSEEKISYAFDKRIWIQMSDKFDLPILFRKMIEYGTHDSCRITNLSCLKEMVKDELVDKRFVLFLDDADIEDKQFWSSTLEVLNAGAAGSVVVLATKRASVAAFTGGTKHSYYLNPLSEENNLMLLGQFACTDHGIQSNRDVMMIAKKFVARFGANPQNLKALGGLLLHSNTVPLEIEIFEHETVPILQLCHDILPDHLKQCLAFYSLFPKGYIFDKHQIVLLWISQRFVLPVKGHELEDIGDGYFNELLGRSFFEYSPSHSDTDDKFVMHELVYDVVVSVSHNKYFKSEDNLADIPESICHLSLVSSQIQPVQLMSRTEDVKDLHALLVVQPEHQQHKTSFPTLNLVGLGDFFLKFTSLKTLDLSCTKIEELPSSIAALRSLHYLSLNSTRIRALPSELCSLSNLQTLEAKHCRFLAELPDDTKSLVSLRHLHLGKELGYVRLPPGVGQLTKLQTLPVFHVGHGCSIVELRSLNSLRGCLLVAGLENVRNGDEARESGLKDKQHLQDLTLQWQDRGMDTDDNDDDDDEAEDVAEQVLDRLQPHPNLKELAIRRYEGSRFPPWMESSSSLPSLVSLTLDSCFGCTRLPAIAQLPSLKFLSVRKTYDVQRLNHSGTHGVIKFPSLELLNLWEMYGLEELFGASDDGGDCPRLKKICISRCPDLKRLPCVPSMAELVLHCCDELPDIPELVSLRSLRIEGLHGVRSLSLPPRLPALKKLEIRCCDELSSVRGLPALTGVERLEIVRCPKLDWPRSN